MLGMLRLLAQRSGDVWAALRGRPHTPVVVKITVMGDAPPEALRALVEGIRGLGAVRGRA